MIITLKHTTSMRSLSRIIFCTLLTVALLPRVVLPSSPIPIEDAENGNTTGWVIYDSAPAGASVTNTLDDALQSRVIELSGTGLSNGFRLGNLTGTQAWNDTEHSSISWRMKTSNNFAINVAVSTTNGVRYIRYDQRVDSITPTSSIYVRRGLGPTSTNGLWQSFSRNLAQDLTDAEPDNTLLAINGFLVRGNMRIDDIELFGINENANSPPIARAGIDLTANANQSVTLDGSDSVDANGTIVSYQWTDAGGAILGNSAAIDWSSSVDGSYALSLTVTDDEGSSASDSVLVSVLPNTNSGTTQLLENAENGNTTGWVVYDSAPAGASVTNTLDDALQSRVIELSGTGLSNGFRVGNLTGSQIWNDTEHSSISWRMKTNNNFAINLAVNTTNGLRYIRYDQQVDSITPTSSIYIRRGLGPTSTNGLWQSFSRNLAQDLTDAEPDNTLLAINGFLVRGNMRLDDIELFGTNTTAPPADPVPNLSNYTMMFNDEFNGSSLNPNKWDTGLLWGPYFPINNEKQLYVDTLGMHSDFSHSPFEFTGSTLKITATPTSSNLQPPARPAEASSVWQPRSYSEYRYNGPSEDGPGYQPSDVDYLSGIITTYESLKMTHGYVEMRAKLPAGQGLWPAFWLLNTHYVEDVPEIDVMEFLGHDVETLYHTYHYFDIEDNWRKISTPSFTVQNTDWTQDFHTYGMAWSPTEIIYYIDGLETRRITDEDYLITGQAMYIIANLAVGGNWPGDPDASTPFPATFEIDYIRAYERKLQPTLNLAADYQLMFEDNFTGSTLDASKWNTSFLWGPYLDINSEDQYYVDALGSDNATAANTPFVLNNGVLSITAREADDPNSFSIPQSLPDLNESIWSDFPTYNKNANYTPGTYTSGIITSYDSFKFVQGYAEMRAKIPKGQGLWPAFWLLNGYYVGQQPEIDILEVLGHAPHQSYHTFHRLSAGGVQNADQGTTDIGNPSVGYADGFHTYGVRWKRGRIDWYIDGNVVHTYEGADVPYQLMYVIANLAVGGSWPGPADETTEFPATLDIDYIRVYQERHKED